MKSLVWSIIVLSLLILTSLLVSVQVQVGTMDLRSVLAFFYLFPILTAIFYFGKRETLVVGWVVLIVGSWALCWPQILKASTLNFSGGWFDPARLKFITGPLFATGVIWELLAFLICAYLIGGFSKQTKVQSKKIEALAQEKKKSDKGLADQKGFFSNLQKKYSEDTNKLSSLIIVISDLSKEIPSVLKMEGLLHLVLEKIVKLLQATKCAIFEVEPSTKKLKFACSVGYDEDKLKGLILSADEESGILGWCAKEGKFLSLQEAQKDFYMADLLREEKVQTLFCQPVVQRGQVVAVICVGAMDRQLSQEEIIRLMSLMSNLTSIAIENAQLMEKTREQAIRDGLTGLYNHRYFHEVLEKQLDLAQKEGRPIGLFMVDIDHFKNFNDTYGHQAGDFVLQETARLLKSQAETSDFAARYGGEEFVLILSRPDVKSMVQTAQKIRRTTEASVFQSGKVNLKVTISLGGAIYQSSEGKPLKKDELIKRADQALYQAKEGGRNRVCVYGEKS